MQDIATAKTDKQRQIIATCCNHPDLSTRQVAKICDTDHSYVVQIMQRYDIVKQETDDYKHHRADILAGLQNKFLSNITDEDIKKAPLGTRILAACQLYDKERLERGQSTANLASIHTDIAELRKLQLDKK